MKKLFHLLLSVCLAASLFFATGASAAAPALPDLPVLNWEPRSDWISVKDHGAVGDGKADDTAAIQKAFDLIQAGVTIYFPAGAYRVTETLRIKSPDKRALYSIALIGHGRDSKVIWDGKAGRNLLEAEGRGYSRVVGIDFDGRGKAAIGDYHFSLYTFETVLSYRHVAFRNFTMAGIYAEPTRDAFAMAETSFENCLFEGCGVGVSFTQFNDYNITFDGCEFRGNGIGVRSWFGNFYVRNCHFEESRDTDIESASEHGCSVRRCTSRNSNRFVSHNNGVSTMVIQDCQVAGWKSTTGAIWLSGAPCLVFDCVFADPPPGATAPITLNGNTRGLLSQNRVAGNDTPAWPKHAVILPAGQRAGLLQSADQRFLKSVVRIPGKVFDVKRDFGAKADPYKVDDTEAIQRTIDAARAHGKGAIAYLPAGVYGISKPLRVTGSDYVIGGAGIMTSKLAWRGPKDQPALAIEGPDHITVENLDVRNHDKGDGGPDILVTGGTTPAPFLTLDGVWVSKNNDDLSPGGLLCRGLGQGATVLVPLSCGNMRFSDCAQASILVGASYYGTLIVDGKNRERDGLTGILSRFSGGRYNVVVRDNQNLVMSDYYSESSGNIFLLEGGADDPSGRVTVQGAKLHLDAKLAQNVLETRNYAGQIVIGPDQFNGAPAGLVNLAGERPLDVVLAGNTFYTPPLLATITGAPRLWLLGNQAVATKPAPPGKVATPFTDSLPVEKYGLLVQALDDLRRLGEVDLRLNHPGALEP